jgi:hypothetical protein
MNAMDQQKNAIKDLDFIIEYYSVIPRFAWEIIPIIIILILLFP